MGRQESSFQPDAVSKRHDQTDGGDLQEGGDEQPINYLSLMDGNMKTAARIETKAFQSGDQSEDGPPRFGTFDKQGRPEFVGKPNGEAVQFKYNGNEKTANEYHRFVMTQDGRRVETEKGKYDPQTKTWTVERNVNGQWQKAVAESNALERVSGDPRTGVVTFNFKFGGKSIAHEAHVNGVVIQREAVPPDQTLNLNPPIMVRDARGNRADVSYVNTRDADGVERPAVDTRKLTDKDGNIVEYAKRNAQGGYDVYRPKDGQKGINPADLADPAKLAQYKYDLTGSKHPLDQPVLMPDNKTGKMPPAELLANGDFVQKKADGTIVRMHGDKRQTEYTIGKDGAPRLRSFQSAFTGENWRFKTDDGGKVTQVELAIPGSGKTAVLQLKDGKFVDKDTGKPPVGQDGKAEHFKFERTKDGGITMIRTNDQGKELTRRTFNPDGSEVMSKAKADGSMVPYRVAASNGVITEIRDDLNPPEVRSFYGQNTRPIQLAKNGDAWVDLSGRAVPEQGTPTMSADGTITWKRPDGKTDVWDRRKQPPYKPIIRPGQQRAA